ncbi:hypothetical protein LTR36_000363 [Oleoguttula mirabilis]|uniref:DUF1690 domain-containing protein n=1 Tax=Oleoguttula mirabilis TaxID=1507867 RepID=A0AAV9K1J4_9PEZI|nr:hypothetical protein LTR36_000363 [Oleoguttula mirabilis]
MGNGGSKPEQHIFTADAPVSFSQSVLDSLQRNPETDSTRARQTELNVQSRVNSELARIRDAQAKQLADLTASLTTNPPSDKTPAPTTSQRDPNSLAAHLSSPFYQDHSPSKPVKPVVDTPADSGRSRDSVQKEIMDLRQKLDARKKVEKTSPEVEKAKEKVVQCLRAHDRRSLDCWQEVEQFKVEVGKLEKKFVDKVGGR